MKINGYMETGRTNNFMGSISREPVCFECEHFKACELCELAELKCTDFSECTHHSECIHHGACENCSLQKDRQEV